MNRLFGTPKNILLILALFTTVLCFSAAQAEIVEIPLSGVAGSYDHTNFQTLQTSFSFNMDPANIISVSIRISGSSVNGLVNCEGDELPYPMDLSTSMFDETTDRYWSSSPGSMVETGPFSYTAEFRSYGTPPTWNFLGDETGSLEIHVHGPPIIGICAVISEPSVVIEEVVLLFDMSSTVQTQSTSWSTIKACYK